MAMRGEWLKNSIKNAFDDEMAISEILMGGYLELSINGAKSRQSARSLYNNRLFKLREEFFNYDNELTETIKATSDDLLIQGYTKLLEFFEILISKQRKYQSMLLVGMNQRPRTLKEMGIIEGEVKEAIAWMEIAVEQCRNLIDAAKMNATDMVCPSGLGTENL